MFVGYKKMPKCPMWTGCASRLWVWSGKLSCEAGHFWRRAQPLIVVNGGYVPWGAVDNKIGLSSSTVTALLISDSGATLGHAPWGANEATLSPRECQISPKEHEPSFTTISGLLAAYRAGCPPSGFGCRSP